MGTKTQMYKFCVKQLELYVHPAKSYSKSEYYFKIIRGLKKCVSLQQVLMIDEDPCPGTEAIALRLRLIELGFKNYLPDEADISDHHRGWYVNVRILFLFFHISLLLKGISNIKSFRVRSALQNVQIRQKP
jgi:hypothetical protein